MRIAELCPGTRGRRVGRRLSIALSAFGLDDAVDRRAAAERGWLQAGHVVADAGP